MNFDIAFKRLTETAMIPTKGTPGSAGYDLYVDTDRDIVIPPGECIPFYTGLAFEIPHNYAGFIYPRSGISTRQGLRLSNCVAVIDSDYRGNVGIPIRNDSDEDQTVIAHERVAQIIFAPICEARLFEKAELSWTQRGTGGFGSTGR